MNCVCTGIALLDFGGERAVSGDLFDVGTHYVFSGNATSDGSVNWYPIDHCPYERRMEPADYWMRRSVFVIPKDKANLNEAARKYIYEHA